MELNLQNSLPIWKQLASRLKEEIVTGRYPAGSRLPSVRDLAAEVGVNPNTMQRAMTQLESDGLVMTNRTSGRIVTEDYSVLESTRLTLAEECVRDYVEKMKALGFSIDEATALIKKGNEDGE